MRRQVKFGWKCADGSKLTRDIESLQAGQHDKADDADDENAGDEFSRSFDISRLALTTLRRQRYQSMYLSPYIMASCGGCLPKYPFDDNWFGDAITEVGALSELVWAPPALILDTYQCYDEGVQNSVNGSRNH